MVPRRQVGRCGRPGAHDGPRSLRPGAAVEDCAGGCTSNQQFMATAPDIQCSACRPDCTAPWPQHHARVARPEIAVRYLVAGAAAYLVVGLALEHAAYIIQYGSIFQPQRNWAMRVSPRWLGELFYCQLCTITQLAFWGI